MLRKDIESNQTDPTLRDIVNRRRNNRDEELNLLFEAPEVLSFSDYTGANLIMLAATQEGNADFISIINELEPSLIDAVNNDGDNPLTYAAVNGVLDALIILLKLKPDLVTKVNKEGNNALMVAAQHKQDKIVNYLFEYRPDLINVTNKQGDNLLFIAAKKDNPELVAKIISLDQSLLKVINNNGDLPIMAAVGERALGAYKVLKRYSSLEDPNMILNTINRQGDSILTIAARVGDLSIFQEWYNYFEGKAKQAKGQIHGMNFLIIAVQNKSNAIVEFIYNRYIQALDGATRGSHRYEDNYNAQLRDFIPLFLQGSSALIAAAINNPSVINQLFSMAQYAGVEEQMEAGILAATQSGNLSSIHTFLNLGRCSLWTPDYSGNNLLMVAILYKKIDVVKYMLSSNFMNQKAFIDYTNNNGDNALILAAQTGDIEITKLLVTYEGVHRFNINHINNQDYNVFAYTPNLEMGLLLIAAGAKELKCPSHSLEQWLKVLGLQNIDEFQVLKKNIEASSLITNDTTFIGTWISELPNELKFHIASTSFLEKYPGVREVFSKDEGYFSILKARLEVEQKSVPKLPGHQEQEDLIGDHINKASKFVSDVVIKTCINDNQINLRPAQQSILTLQVSNWLNNVLQSEQQLFGGYVFPELRAELMRSTFRILNTCSIPFPIGTREAIEKVANKVLNTIPTSYVQRYAMNEKTGEQHGI